MNTEQPTNNVFIDFLTRNFDDYDTDKASYVTGKLSVRTIAYANKAGGFTVLSENSLTVVQRLELEAILTVEKHLIKEREKNNVSK
jgi:hypothetical protein